ncbi:MAG: penicillin-binding transpeptidase domain-containing protein [Candidatus Uhrbacteria bacterium]
MDQQPADQIDYLPNTRSQGQAVADGAAGYLGRTVSNRRITVAFTVIFLLLGVLIFRASELQVFRGSSFLREAERNRTRTSIIPTQRGAITDRYGAPLVRNVPEYAIGVIPADLPSGPLRSGAVADIASAVGVEVGALNQALDVYPLHLSEPVVIRDGLSYSDAIRLFVAAHELPAVAFVIREQRVYGDPEKQIAESIGHVLGYVGMINSNEYAALASERYRPSDRIGKDGIELSYEGELRGVAGVRTLAINASGRVVGAVAEESPRAGSAIELTIDRSLQNTAERALRGGLRASGAARGAVVVLDASDGAIRALVSWPAFSSTALARGLTADEYAVLTADKDAPLFPRAIAGLYPSGSTIKPFIAAGALSRGIINSKTRVFSSGGLRVAGSIFPDWLAGGHGWVDVVDALAYSVNTFFYVIGGGWPEEISNSRRSGRDPDTAERSSGLKSSAFGGSAVGGQISKLKEKDAIVHPLGPDGITETLSSFGFGAPTGIDLPGEAAGLLPTAAWKAATRGEPWYIGDTYHLAIGQGDILVTPLQLAAATAILANNGQRVQPHVAVVAATEPKPISDITAEAITVVRRGLRAAVTRGSARALSDFEFPVYGKTGTAQTVVGRRPHAWFIGFAERDNSSIVVVVLLEEGGEGSVAAVPVARTIFEAWSNSIGAR